MQSRLRRPGPTGLSLPAFPPEALPALNQHLRRRPPGGEATEMRRQRPVRPAGAGMNHPKRQVFVDSFSFEEPNRRGTHKKSTTPSGATTKNPKANRKKAMPQPAAQPSKPKPNKQKPRKAPTPKRTPEEQREARRLHEQARNRTPERREYRRRYAEEQRQRARLLGRCQNCSKPAIPGLSRCKICAEANRQSRRRSDARRRAAAKER